MAREDLFSEDLFKRDLAVGSTSLIQMETGLMLEVADQEVPGAGSPKSILLTEMRFVA